MATFTDKVIIVTGASEGIGRALALELAPQRPKLVLAARNEERLATLAVECVSAGAEASTVRADLTDEMRCRQLVLRAIERFGRIDALVNNAGATMWARVEDVVDTTVFERVLRINYLSSVWCTYYALPHLRETRGRIVAVSSLAGMTGVPTRSGYAASKHAVFGFFDSLRIELDGSGVSVTLIAPGFVRTEIHRRALGPDGSPLGASPLQDRRIMSAKACAALIARAMARRQRRLVISWRGRALPWLKLLAPALLDRLARKAIEGRR
ncbi:MAG TPA: SDR family oxidoreductase [Gammaproteobacteria bacterium]|nr:SDR family oxidoreductase [Gammaproteobacteria bacterium]